MLARRPRWLAYGSSQQCIDFEQVLSDRIPIAQTAPHHLMDTYGRAKTVRIGKWRWLPARTDDDPSVPQTGSFRKKGKKL